MECGVAMRLFLPLWTVCSVIGFSVFIGPMQGLLAEDGTRRVQLLDYQECIELSNPTTRVVLGHHVGGRVLVYERGGNNVLYLSPREADWKAAPNRNKPEVTAGRLDVGPELLSRRGPALWSGQWESEIIGPRAARLTSAIDPESGLQIVRDFRLAADSSRLTIQQQVINRGSTTSRHAFWSRAFAVHGGIGIVPVTPDSSRYPNLYTMHADRASIQLRPVDGHVRRQGDFLVIDGPPAFPKLGFDSSAGWVAYQTPTDLLFVHHFPVYPERIYAEATGMTLSLWYPERERIAACEIEPIGPLEVVPPGQSSSFSVDGWLLEHPYPDAGAIDPEAIAALVTQQCLTPPAAR
jgi:hypothetical protein